MKRSSTSNTPRKYSQHRIRSRNPERNYTDISRDGVAYLAGRFMEEMQAQFEAAESAGKIAPPTTRHPRRWPFMPRVTIKTYELHGGTQATLTYLDSNMETPIRATMEEPAITVNGGRPAKGHRTTISLAGDNPLIRFDVRVLQARSVYGHTYDVSYATYANDYMAQSRIDDQIRRMDPTRPGNATNTPAGA